MANSDSNGALNAKIDFIADLPVYDTEKPFFVYPSADQSQYLTKNADLSNVQWDTRPVTLHSMRDLPCLSLLETGFEYIEHESTSLPQLLSGDTTGYQEETERLLASHFEAEYVKCYVCKRRVYHSDYVEVADQNGEVVVESFPRGAHGCSSPVGVIKNSNQTDISLDTVPEGISAQLSAAQQEIYLRDGYRFRIINVWRPLLPVLENHPFAVCDFASVDGEDLLATDRVWPSRVQEIYYLKHNPNQRWYWLPLQKSSEPLMTLMYDSHAENSARYCPYISVENPDAGSSAPLRRSIETKSLVVTKLTSTQ